MSVVRNRQPKKQNAKSGGLQVPQSDLPSPLQTRSTTPPVFICFAFPGCYPASKSAGKIPLRLSDCGRRFRSGSGRQRDVSRQPARRPGNGTGGPFPRRTGSARIRPQSACLRSRPARRSYPKGETAIACADSFSLSRAANNFPCSHALELSPSRLGRCPN